MDVATATAVVAATDVAATDAALAAAATALSHIRFARSMDAAAV